MRIVFRIAAAIIGVIIVFGLWVSFESESVLHIIATSIMAIFSFKYAITGCIYHENDDY